jgi:hypothetical protein
VECHYPDGHWHKLREDMGLPDGRTLLPSRVRYSYCLLTYFASHNHFSMVVWDKDIPSKCPRPDCLKIGFLQERQNFY